MNIEKVAKAIEADAGLPLAELRDWEQGRVTPPGGVLCLLRLIKLHPELSIELETA